MSLPELIEIKNGSLLKPTFSKDEMEARLIKLRKYLKDSDIQAAIFTSIQNINYFADFVYCAFGRPYGLIVTHDRITTLTANIVGGQPYRQTFGHDNLVYTDWKKDNIFRGVQKLVPNKGKVGIEFDHVTLERKQMFEDALDQAQLVDIGNASMQIRMLKSAEEHDILIVTEAGAENITHFPFGPEHNIIC